MKGKFEKKIILWSILTALIPLLLSYGIFIYDKFTSIQDRVDGNLYRMSVNISKTPFIIDRLSKHQQDMSIQNYTSFFVDQLEDVDIIVIADMNGIKYSHLDETQIGEVFVNEDKWKILHEGVPYFSLKKGSQGLTQRRFEPVFKDGKQIGFVMVGKYYNDLKLLTVRTAIMYLFLFLGGVILIWILAGIFAKNIKDKILGLEPEEISRLYKEKTIILNNVNEGIIALDKSNKIMEVNSAYLKLFPENSPALFIEEIKNIIFEEKPFDMKEIIIFQKKIFISFHPIINSNEYIGSIITITSRSQIKDVVEEITGVDQIIKSMRANIHEFKNRLHVITGLLELKKYDILKNYVLELQEVEKLDQVNFNNIDDYYIKGILIGKLGIAKEQRINLKLKEGSLLYEKHGIISYNDLIVIIGNLIENAFESFHLSNIEEKNVILSLMEDKEFIEISVFDNGSPVDPKIKDKIFQRGISSKGNKRGSGLYLVKNRTKLYNGNFSFREDTNGKTFTIRLFKEVNYNV
ncbi:ATP-binding protein [Psychrilyobacter atlanticus]|uniref:ATP-binding protein n=1 Tax=Psychrilyobacter atlanticus TaxID=271091 RepID=UPI00040DBD07|nr:ATP-binding protein [Psychrilyobacter atlanticus]